MRQELAEAIKAVFLSEGSHFYRGFTTAIAGSGLELPALWLTPPEVIAQNGRKEGKTTYKVTLYLFVQNEQYSEDQKEEKWEAMEQQVRKGFAALPLRNEIVAVDKLTCTPDEFTYTQYGELSVKVTFNADVYYCDGAA